MTDNLTQLKQVFKKPDKAKTSTQRYWLVKLYKIGPRMTIPTL